eukprot:scaffold206200_cov26-Tisochrysis_lutea.AAC.1
MLVARDRDELTAIFTYVLNATRARIESVARRILGEVEPERPPWVCRQVERRDGLGLVSQEQFLVPHGIWGRRNFQIPGRKVRWVRDRRHVDDELTRLHADGQLATGTEPTIG